MDLPLSDPGIIVCNLIKKTQKKFSWGIIPHISEKNLPILNEMNKSNKNE